MDLDEEDIAKLPTDPDMLAWRLAAVEEAIRDSEAGLYSTTEEVLAHLERLKAS